MSSNMVIVKPIIKWLGGKTQIIDDVKSLASSVLRHRVVTSFSAEAEDVNIEEIISYIINKID